MKLQHRALVLVWLSVVTAGAGAYLRQRSPAYERWQTECLGEIAKHTDGPLIAAAIGTHWQFELFFDTVLALMFTLGMLASSRLILRGPNLGWILVVAFGSGCILGAWSGIVEGVSSWRWGFVLHGAGCWLASTGLTLAVVALWQMRTNPCKGE